MQKKINIELLFKKYIDNNITDDELFQLRSYFQTDDNNDGLEVLLEEYFALESKPSSALHEKSDDVASSAWNKIQKVVAIRKPSLVSRISWLTKVAAAILIIASISVYSIYNNRPGVPSVLKNYSADVQPGTTRATLIYSNGKAYQLSSSKQEIFTNKGGVSYKDGTLIENKETDENVTLSTPKGGQYAVTLSDGTKVWLNASSSLSYPTSFTGKERRVELIGEAYFEVHHDTKQPFIVSANGQQVKVLGTSFNLNAYREEHKTVTTLVNGSVQLTSEGNIETRQLHPGEQSVLENDGFEIGEVDVSLFVAWKDGQFRFKATPLVEVMRQIERWYNLDVDYTGFPADIQIHASISRDKKLSTVIEALEKITNLKFNVKGRSVKLMR